MGHAVNQATNAAPTASNASAAAARRAPQSTKALNEAVAEATVHVQQILKAEGGGGCGSLHVALELLGHLRLAATVVRPLLCHQEHGSEIMRTLEAFRARARAATAPSG